MRLGVLARTFPGTAPREAMAAARAAGFTSVQWNMACGGLGSLPREVPEAAARAVREASEAEGVAVAAVSATYNMVHPDEGVREAGRAAFGAVAGAARAMGCGIVTVCTGSRDAQDQWRRHPDNDRPDVWDAFVAEMRAILPVAERHGVVVGVEPETANVVSSPERAERMLAAFPGAPLGIVLDPANLFEDEAGFRGGAAVDEAVGRLAGRIVLAHAKDRDASGEVVPAGRGLVDWGGFLRRLRGAGFDGDVVAHGFEAGDAAAVARHLRDAMGGAA